MKNSSDRRIAGVAPGKLNLFLEVLGRRPDGYHELRTVFHEIDLADDVEVELRPDAKADSLELAGIDLEGPIEQNLALLAAAAFRRHVRPAPPVHVRLHKKIPPGSGMGGGSSDAAFVLRALDALCSTRCEPTGEPSNVSDLGRAAREVGADVAFFLSGGTALGCGRGDELTRMETAETLHFLLALPRFSLSTARVYAHVDLIAPRADVSSFAEGMRRKPRGEPVKGCFNRLEAAAAKVEPRLAPLLEELRSATKTSWSMTGSGSSLFAPMSSMASAAELEVLAKRVAGPGPLDLRIVQSFGLTPAPGTR